MSSQRDGSAWAKMCVVTSAKRQLCTGRQGLAETAAWRVGDFRFIDTCFSAVYPAHLV